MVPGRNGCQWKNDVDASHSWRSSSVGQSSGIIIRVSGVRIPPPLLPGAAIMKLGLINSAWAQAGRETGWGIRKTKELGFDTIDIFADPLDIGVRERCGIK